MNKKLLASCSMIHYGEYETWNRASKDIPELKRITHTIIARVDAEFGYCILIKGLKGKKIKFVIEHPPFCDDQGNISAPFEGEVLIHSNSFTFYLGDCVWNPVHDKVGAWRLRTNIDGVCVADKTLYLISEHDEDNIDW
jgi:hypothetical protein